MAEEGRKSKLLYVIVFVVILIAGALLLFWHGFGGKEKLTYDGVLVSRIPIPRGTTITGEMLAEAQISPENEMYGALKTAEASIAIGSIAKIDIPMNAQICTSYFYENDLYLEPQQSIFRIHEGWINNLSQSLRRGDYISIYSADGNTYLGSYRVAFCNVERVENEEGIIIGEDSYADAIDRDTTREFTGELEIVARLDQYQKIYEDVYGTPDEIRAQLRVADDYYYGYDEETETVWRFEAYDTIRVTDQLLIMQVADFDEAAAIEADRLARIAAAEEAARLAEEQAQAEAEAAVPAE